MKPRGPDAAIDPGACPLCGRPNDCQLCSLDAFKGECWCASAEIPPALLERVPPRLTNLACICRDCVVQFGRAAEKSAPIQETRPGDSYFDAQGLMVFTAAYHLRRGYCCDSGCRHCPYEKKPEPAAPIPRPAS